MVFQHRTLGRTLDQNLRLLVPREASPGVSAYLGGVLGRPVAALCPVQTRGDDFQTQPIMALGPLPSPLLPLPTLLFPKGVGRELVAPHPLARTTKEKPRALREAQSHLTTQVA